ncbi:MAG: tetratricopeptide repeat protein [Bacteroidales bacterium]|nr:tetratricopeptide repeat protein [Bacteroidales bacterium]
MKRLAIKIWMISVLVTATTAVQAQRPVIYDSPNREYNNALELFQKRQYGAAQEYFHYVVENTTEQQQDMKSNSYFYEAACAAHLNHENAAFLLKDFIRRYPFHTYVPDAYMYVARFYFYKKQYKKALNSFNEIDERTVKEADLAEFNFKKGYSSLVAGDRDDAKYLFREARKYEGEYQKKATYYLAHLAYEDGYYESALTDFKSLQNEKEYAKVVPFYITQIHFIEKQYDTVIATAPALLEESTDKAELNRIIGLSYYNLGQYSKALPHFNEFLRLNESNKKSAATISQADNYAIGYTCYKTQEYGDAVTYLAKATDSADALAQNALYVIGDCQLKLKQPRQAAQSFLQASQMEFDAEIQEDAYYNYAKLQYETSSLPFTSAIKALEDYIAKYPHSSRSAEATSYLATIYASTKNYQEAIKSIEKLDTKTPQLLRSYQRCTHFRAMELIENKEYKNAAKMIDKSMLYPIDPKIQLQNLYWKAEAEYRSGSYDQAYKDFLIYQKASGATSDSNYPISFYSLGYTDINLEKYKEGQQAFEKFLTYAKSIEDEKYIADAYARLGDCFYMQKNLRSAITNYDKCEKMKSLNADYALYQESTCYGYLQNNSKKMALLEKFANLYSRSSYIDKAQFELASTYHAEGQYKQAINSYQEFINKYPKSPYVSKAYNRMAQAYLNAQETDKSIATYKKVVEKYPGSQEAKDALTSLEDIYTDQGNTGDFFDYIRSKGINSVTPEHQDSITYKSAFTKYEKGNCEDASPRFANYLRDFPNGYFAAEAHFYKGECAYGRNSYDEALADYEYLIENYRTENNEIALKKAATIRFNKNDFNKALSLFNELLSSSTSEVNTAYAYNGIMRCAYELNNYKDALEGAKGYIASKNADPELSEDAKLIAGKSSFQLRDYSGAKKFLKPLAESSTNDLAAEAAYYCALSEFKQGHYDECENAITDVLEANYTSSYWLAQTFILYGDLYAAKGNTFQARHTYQSIVDNYDGEDLRTVARERIAQLDRLENPATDSVDPDLEPEQDDEE